MENRTHTAVDTPLKDQKRLKERITFDRVQHVLNLPVEIISQIFGLCIAPTPTLHEFTSNHLYDSIHTNPNRELIFQLILGGVCRTWRQILWTDTRFWTLCCLRLTPQIPVGVATLVTEWLGRSEQQPLVICLKYYDSALSDGRNITESLRPFLEAVCSVSDRWALVSFQLPHILMHGLRCDPSRPPRSLNGLVLSITEYQAAPTFNLGIEPSPERVWLDTPVHSVRLQWKRLTHLRVQGHQYIEELSDILRGAPKLVHLQIVDVHIKESRESPLTVHHGVQSLEVLNSSVALWDAFSFPLLREMVIDGEALEEQDTAVIKFISRSQCSLVKISVHSGGEGVDGLITLLCSTPTVEHLLLEYVELDEEFFASFAELQGFLPNLSTLVYAPDSGSFHWPHLFSLSLSTAAETQTIRRSLKQITLQLEMQEAEPSMCDVAMFEEDDLQMIEEFRNGGIDLRVIEHREGKERDLVELWLGYYRAQGEKLDDSLSRSS